MKRHFSTVRSASRIILGVCLIALGLLASGTPLPAGAPEDDAAKEKKVYHATRILISGMINEVLVTTVQRRSDDAIRGGANLIIFEIDSDGGLVTSAMALSRAIDGLSDSGVHTVAYIPRRAYSAAAMAAISCKDIYMKVGSSLGDAAPISMLGKLEGVQREKLESALRSRFEDLARRNSYPVGLAKSMVTITVTVAEAKNSKTGQVRYIEEDELFGLGSDWKKGKIIVGPTELLTMDADKATKYGFARGLVEEIEELRKFFDIEGEITVYSLTASEEVVGLLNNMYLKALLVLVGLIGIYVEMSTPGFGIPGTAALVAF
ncbi:MAG: hypothetical protein QF662_06610, partial [Phycisphaerae bacterium]|nr:hypothetical protein [Phycisphaerae bacterium]